MIVIRSSAMNMYVESILQEALSRGHDVDLLYSEDRLINAISYAADNRDSNTIKWKEPREEQLPFVSRLSIFLRRLINYGLFVCRVEQSHHYVARYEKQLPGIARNSRLIKKLIALPSVTNLLIRMDKSIKPSAEVSFRVKQFDPDVLITAPHNKTPALETEFVKAANLLSIPNAIVPLSWDNLTTKGLINVLPTRFLAWNQVQLETAKKYHFVPHSIITTVGAPVFDRWFDYRREILSEKMVAEFLHDVAGIPRGKRFILYLGSAANITGDESWLINDLAVELSRHADLRDVAILVRPHPANYGFSDAIDHPNCVVYPKAGSLPSEDKSREEMFISLKSAICTIGVNTSGMLDAVINDVNTIAICHKAYIATQNQTMHFKELLDFGCIDYVHDVADIPQKIREIDDFNDSFSAERRKFVEVFVRPVGLSNCAGKAIMESLENLV